MSEPTGAADDGGARTPSDRWLALTRWGNRTLREATWARRAGIVTYRTMLSAVRVLPRPRVLVNGHFKSGTHLLSDCVALLPQMVFSGRHFTLSEFLDDERVWLDAFTHHEPRPDLDLPRLRRYLAMTPPGMFATSHIGHRAEVETLLARLGFRHVLLFRDPRDIVVSHVKFVMRQRSHFDHRYYAEVLADDGQRIMAAIRGFVPPDGTGLPAPSIGESMAGFLRWRTVPGILETRYETLIGAAGGSSRDHQIAEIQRIGAFLDRPVDATQADGIAERMYSTKSFTFRKGGTGDWREHFTDDHRAAFKEVANDVLVALGYERDDTW